MQHENDSKECSALEKKSVVLARDCYQNFN